MTELQRTINGETYRVEVDDSEFTDAMKSVFAQQNRLLNKDVLFKELADLDE